MLSCEDEFGNRNGGLELESSKISAAGQVFGQEPNTMFPWGQGAIEEIDNFATEDIVERKRYATCCGQVERNAC